MIKSQELSDPTSCLNRAREDEMVFVLLERDTASPETIRFWCGERVRKGKNRWEDAQIVEALRSADAMEASQWNSAPRNTGSPNSTATATQS